MENNNDKITAITILENEIRAQKSMVFRCYRRLEMEETREETKKDIGRIIIRIENFINELENAVAYLHYRKNHL